MARLDRCLINQEWLRVYPDSLLEYDAPLFSEHSLMYIHKDKATPKGKKPFRFFNMWSTHPQFLDVIRSDWNVNVQGSPPLHLMSKTQSLQSST